MLETSKSAWKAAWFLIITVQKGKDRCTQSFSISQVITTPWGRHRCHTQPLYDCKKQLRPPQGSLTVMHTYIFIHTIRCVKSLWFWWVITNMFLANLFYILQLVKYKIRHKRKSDVNGKIYSCLTTEMIRMEATMEGFVAICFL